MKKLSAAHDAPPRGPRGPRGEQTERIVAVARAHFAAHGFAGTTLRAVAREAGVDPALVRYYFDGKADLLEACLAPPPGYLEGIARAAALPLDQRAEAFVRHLIGAWERPESAEILRSMILTAAHEPVALDRLRAVFSRGVLGAVAEHLDPAEQWLRAGLAATQLVGLSMIRYVWRLDPVASLPPDQVVALVAPTVQRYLSGTLPA